MGPGRRVRRNMHGRFAYLTASLTVRRAGKGSSGMSRQASRAALVGLLAIVGMFVYPGLAGASTCGSSLSPAQNGYAGYATYPASWAQTPEGVSGYIESRLGPVCSNKNFPSTFSTAWVMLQDYNVGNHYAQAGYMYDNTAGCNRYFTEWNVGGGYHRALGACALSDGEEVTSRVEYQGSPGAYPPTVSTMLLSAGSVTTVANFDPWNEGWTFSPTFAGEVDHTVNDVPGSVYYKADLSSLGIQSVSTGNLIQVPCYLRSYWNGSTARYYHTAYGCDHIAVWTDPY